MQQEGVQPNLLTFVGVLNACASIVALEDGRHVHEQIIQSSCKSDVYVGCSLVDMYEKCGSMEDAWRVFNKMPSWDVVTWTAMIMGHVKCGKGQKALELFHQMQQEDVQPNCVTFVGVLNACGSIVALERAGVLMSRSLNVDGIQMFLCRVACLKCMQNVGAWRMLGECSIRCHHMM
jgi:pentatricopeptide repeat protein